MLSNSPELNGPVAGSPLGRAVAGLHPATNFISMYFYCPDLILANVVIRTLLLGGAGEPLSSESSDPTK